MPGKIDADADETKVLVSEGGVTLAIVDALNLDAAVAYLQLFDAAAEDDVTLGTTVPDISIHFAASASRTVDLGDIPFPRGCVYAVTTTINGLTGPTTGLRMSLAYR